ncbi:GMP synthase [glutamine-hydrolyzing] [Candidatus Entotheonellaceae bacterium PAL068K]
MRHFPDIQRFSWGTAEDDQVLIVHYGSKSTPMIAQQLRQIGLQSKVIHASEVSAELGRGYRPKLAIFSGGDDNVSNRTAPTIADADLTVLRQDSVILGICYGAQWLATKLGGHVAAAVTPEFGEVSVQLVVPLGAYRGGTVVMNHNDEIVTLPPGWRVIGSTNHCQHALVGNQRLFAAMFHPEMDHTQDGDALLAHLAYDLAGCQSDYTYDLDRYVEQCVAWLHRSVPSGEVELALSGGVDSAVAYQLAQRAYGSRLHATFVDTGFMRAGEAQEVQGWFGTDGVSYLDAADVFMEHIESIPYPGPEAEAEASYYDQVRHTVGACFIDVFARHARQQGRTPVALVQGTNYADIIESNTHLKAHHNVGGLPATLDVRVVEPLAGLFKFEIRQLAAYLGLPQDIVYRQPSPGPGLSIRMWGTVTRAKTNALRQATRILEDLMRQHYPQPELRPSQYYVALAPLPSCGLMGDDRVYGYAWVIRGVVTHARESYVTVSAFDFSQAFLQEAARRLTNEVTLEDGTRFVRVFVEVTGKPPSTTEPH